MRAQVTVTAPLERAVYQRDLDKSANVTISGSYSISVDKIEVHVVPVNPAQGTEIPWKTLLTNPTGGVFSGTVRIAGGWYSIEVRGSKNGVIIGDPAKISRVGVGEVFIISGQSNAQGINYTSPVATDERVNYIDHNNEITNSLDNLPPPLFTQLNNSNITMGLRGHGTWCWGILGDLLTVKLNVPVLFVNTAWEGTAMLNWNKSSRNEATWDVASGLIQFAPQMPYANVRLSMQHYVKQYGARAILWMQGESDTYPLNTNFNDYKNGLQDLINKLSSDINFKIPWVIARTSRVANQNKVSVTSPSIIAAQNAVIQDLAGVAYAGPETDNLYVSRGGDGTHFQGVEGTTILANAWNDVLNDTFFSTVNPVSVSDEPKITSTCAANNTSVTLTLPDGYLNYFWYTVVNGNLNSIGGGRTINISNTGTYIARVKDAYGNTLLSQKMVISSSIKPATPTIVQSGSQQVCADSSFTFSINAGNDQYTWYKQGSNDPLISGNSITVSESGNYFVRSQSVFGCLSDNSNVSSLIVRPVIPTPVIAKSGPFTATATINETGLNESYDWKRDEQILTTSTTSSVRTNVTGTYSARARETFAIGTNLLTCYSPFSNELEVITEGESDIVVFPNPGSRDNIYVESRDDISSAEITVYDLLGRVMTFQKQDMKSRVKIPVRNLSSGKYIVRIKGPGIDVTRQIVVL
ncbi:sialate O-acetylesterase [Dyadobacter subterraneus]|uniref:T9SS type A sorting domain-containing protein n=1 Tax=Dyadobacter subterraneus TaxID=2773304 RepID=A0ABR9WA69_9BACT|nr:sialate O-acetylesterase [Dyadobacter subterraneus]MBE9462347.1 T9SS type A sorting domain-containing protein [Dyadobacter subterraneus]